MTHIVGMELYEVELPQLLYEESEEMARRLHCSTSEFIGRAIDAACIVVKGELGTQPSTLIRGARIGEHLHERALGVRREDPFLSEAQAITVLIEEHAVNLVLEEDAQATPTG